MDITAYGVLTPCDTLISTEPTTVGHFYMPVREGVHGMTTITASVLANNILSRAFAQSSPVSPMKLQKLLYFIYRDYLQRKEVPLFSERFEVWKYGPVLPNVYQEFKQYGSNHIASYSKDSSGDAYLVKEEPRNTLTEIIDENWNAYKNVNGIYLSQITHRPNSAWYKAFQNGILFLDDEDIRNDQER